VRHGAARLAAASDLPDWDRDFNGTAYDNVFRGAYSGEGVNPGWTPALSQKTGIG
jgi:hypothetical protein